VIAPASQRRRDLRITAWLLLAVLGWDAVDADLPAARLFAGAHGFAARDSTWASALVHGGGRWLAWLTAATLFLVALRTPNRVRVGPHRAERLAWLGAALVCAVAVPALKRFSATSCPWDLAEFGGAARHLSHWAWGAADGGAGHCFPSGHAVAAFAFLAMHFQWRRHDAARARAWLLAVLGVGALFGLGQLARGAHYPSHTLWSAWLCWAICVGADRFAPGGDGARQSAPAGATNWVRTRQISPALSNPAAVSSERTATMGVNGARKDGRRVDFSR
jgi:membrane-associated PAP2 superfamily phosphatase